MSTYADKIDVLKNPMLCVGMPVSVIFDLTDGSQIALNSVDATEWCARSPERFSRTATRAKTETQQIAAPKAIVGSLVRSGSASTGAELATYWVFDNVLNQTWIVPGVDAIEWVQRDPSRYSFAT